MAANQHLASREDILTWANRIVSRAQLPEIVRRLIRETNDQLFLLDMPSDEGTARHGYDGIVEAGRATPFVPEGRSVWEMGVDKNPVKKANDDYEGRTANPLNEDMPNTTFCFVTPRQFPNKRDWERERTEEGKWRAVRVLDIDDIWAALDTAIATHVRLSEFVDRPGNGVLSLESWWAKFARQSSPQLTPELVLAGRLDSASGLLSVLENDVAHTQIRGASVDDVIAFVAATLLTAEEDRGRQLLDRALVVLDVAALRHLDTHATLLILVPFVESMYREARLLTSHHVIYLTQGDIPSDLELPPIDPDEFASILVGHGVEESRAHRLGTAASSSLLAFHQLAPASGLITHPSWLSQLAPAPRRRAWLAGAWNGTRSADREVMAALSGTTYEALEEELRAVLAEPDPTFSKVGQTWSVLDRGASWEYASHGISPTDLERLQEAVQTVLGLVDPTLQLPASDRWSASIRGVQRIHSTDLRKGIAKGLAVIGTFGARKVLGRGVTAARYIDTITFGLLNRANVDTSGSLWASLADVLPQLAEASPDVFLRSVDEATQGAEPLIATMFADDRESQSFLSVTSPHTGLLWALETLAWSEDYFGLAVGALTRLAALDPGGRLSNRPAASLENIFRPWGPQTSASEVDRQAALERMAESAPSVAWPLLLSILPRNQGVGHYTHHPEFRLWVKDAAPITLGDLWRQHDHAAAQLLLLAATSPERWPSLLERVDDLRADQRVRILEQLQAASSSSTFTAEQKQDCWKVLDSMIRHHQAFPDAAWSMDDEQLEHVRLVADQLAPDRPEVKNKWLFDDAMPDIPDRMELDFEDFEQRVEQLREQAIREILDSGGIEQLTELAQIVAYPGALGWALGRMPEDFTQQAIACLESENGKSATFGQAYFQSKSERKFDWLADLVVRQATSDTGKARLLLCARPSPEVWTLLEDLGRKVQESYWREFSPYGLGADFPWVGAAAGGLLSVGRPAAALHLMALYRKTATKDEASLIVDAFEALLRSDASELQLLRAYDVEELLEILRSSDVDIDTVAGLEWQLMPLVDYNTPSPVLERKMASDAEFFVEVLSLAFRSEGEDEEPDENAAARAGLAFRLLHEFKTIPGSSDRSSPVNEAALRDWILEVRRQAAARDRADIAETYVGQVLAHSSEDEDGTWPSRPVRNVIESLASPTLESGFSTGTFNKRGVTSRGATEGGAQEYALAEKFQEWATAVRSSAPRTAAILQNLADGYASDGLAQDERAALRRRGLGSA